MSMTWEDELLLMREQILYLMERLAERPAQSERPVNWEALDEGDAAEQWSVLLDWMVWLRDRYQLHERIPSCWYAHGALIEELSALRTAWVGAYLDPQTELDAPTQWHELLDKALARIREWDLSGCSDGTHRPQQPLPDNTDLSLLRREFLAVSDLLLDAMADLAAFAGLPLGHWQTIWSTNPLQRLSREVKRRTDVIGIVSNTDSLRRLAACVQIEARDEWLDSDRRYQSEASMRQLNPPPPTVLEAKQTSPATTSRKRIAATAWLLSLTEQHARSHTATGTRPRSGWARPIGRFRTGARRSPRLATSTFDRGRGYVGRLHSA